MSSQKNESMNRADLTMDDLIQETCQILVVISGPTEPKIFQEAWHCPIEKERDNLRTARKEIGSIIEKEAWRKTDRKKIYLRARLSYVFTHL